MDIEDAEIAIDPASLTALVNHAFDYRGSSLSNLRVSFENGFLVQRGTLHKGLSLPFTVMASVDVTPDGLLKIHPEKSKSGRNSIDETAVDCLASSWTTSSRAGPTAGSSCTTTTCC